MATNIHSNGAFQNAPAIAADHASGDLVEQIRLVAGKKIQEAMLTQIHDFANRHMGAVLPGRETVKHDARLTKKQDGITHSVTPVSSDGKLIDGILIHGRKIGKGNYSVVKEGLIITQKAGEWQVEMVAMHRGDKHGDAYRQRLNNNQAAGVTGVYLPKIVKHKELFQDQNHPNVESAPSFYGWLDSNHEVMVHELRCGDITRKPCQTSEAVIKMGKGIVKGLAFYHNFYVLFRDLKPENILLDHSGKPVLSDPMEEREDRVKDTSGSPAFMPVELTIRGNKQSKASDLYALGLTLRDLKYLYLQQAIQSISDLEKRKECQSELDDSISNSDKLAGKVFELSMGMYDRIALLHTMNEQSICPDRQIALIENIAKANGFAHEEPSRIKERLKRFDAIIKQLLDRLPQNRPSALDVYDSLKAIA